ncbi:MAG: hypothetical protein ABFC77_00370 [Thermoguttaceae bacterium]
MKSERRHELQHNELALWLERLGETIKPYQNMIWIAVAAVLVFALGYTLWSRQASARTTRAWDELNIALSDGGANLVTLAKIADEYPGTNVGQTAAVVLADCHLGEGCARLFASKAGALQELNKAIALYQMVSDQTRFDSLRERAAFGLARAAEAKGELSEAGKRYAEVASRWPKGAYAVAAADRADDLKRQSTKEFYDKFKSFDPKPAYSSDSKGSEGSPVFDASSLPAEPEKNDVDLPATTLDLKLDAKGKADAKGKDAAPAKSGADKK